MLGTYVDGQFIILVPNLQIWIISSKNMAMTKNVVYLCAKLLLLQLIE